ncbi:hypothetical protein [Microbacterium indicum]|nr:hypothetical protein [Microbacterium indicum]
MRAVELTGDERAAAWSRFTAMSPGFKQYEENTTPVIALRRVAADA